MIRTSQVLTPTFLAVVANHLETDRPLLLEGDFLCRNRLGNAMGAVKAEKLMAAFVRSLTEKQRSALAGLMELVDGEEVLRWF